MPLLISIIAAVVAFLIAYPCMLTVGYRILKNKRGFAKTIKFASNGAALVSSFGWMKLLTHILSVLLIELILDKEKIIQSLFFIFFLPALLILLTWLLIKAFSIFGYILPPPAKEELYLKFMKEAQGEERRDSLWAKCLINFNGDERRALAEYVKIRIKETNNSSKPIDVENFPENNLKQTPSRKFSKIRPFLLLATSLAVAIIYITDSYSSNTETKKSVTIGNASGVRIYDFFNCQKCIDGSCMSDDKTKQIVINFSNAVGFLRVKTMFNNEEMLGGTTPWSGCEYRNNGGYVAACNYNYEYGSVWRSRHRDDVEIEFDGERFSMVKTMTKINSINNWGNKVIGTDKLTCEAKLVRRFP